MDMSQPWHERARRMHVGGMRYVDIARQFGVTSSAVWKACNPERAAEMASDSNNKRRDARRDWDRAAMRRNRARCETCGKPCGIGSGRNGHRPSQCQACVHNTRLTNATTIELLWAEGHTQHEIAAELGWTIAYLKCEISRLRAEGLAHLPYRIPESRRLAMLNAAQARYARQEQAA
jgi:transposase